MTGPRIGSLFSGYMGLDMAVEAVTGGTTVWVSDIDKGARKILEHRAPDVPNLGDITAIDWSTVDPVDILTGGFPCQDLSHAGKRAGMKEGTRSGLWSHMARAIDELRPRLVVAENVRGLLSAQAPGEVEPCPWCVGDGPTVDLRALGVVLADMADLGYDAQWCGLRAADVGACHGRFRVFVIAYPEGDRWDEGRPEPAGIIRRPDVAQRGHADVVMLPTPATSDTNGHGPHGDGGLDLRTAVSLLPTPTAQAAKHSTDDRGPGTLDDANLWSVAARLLPTPVVNDMGEGKTPSEWAEWAECMRQSHGNGNGHGASLSIEAQKLLPTTTRDVKGRNQRDDETCLTGALLPTPKASDGEWGTPRTSGRPAEKATHLGTRVSLLPTPMVGSTSAEAHGQISGQFREQMDAALARFGDYAPAVARWAANIGRFAPEPTEPTGRNGAHRLSPKFTEWMMGLPAGWVTDVPGLTRNEALKACGNGVVPQQAEAALRHMLSERAA